MYTNIPPNMAILEESDGSSAVDLDATSDVAADSNTIVPAYALKENESQTWINPAAPRPSRLQRNTWISRSTRTPARLGSAAVLSFHSLGHSKWPGVPPYAAFGASTDSTKRRDHERSQRNHQDSSARRKQIESPTAAAQKKREAAKLLHFHDFEIWSNICADFTNVRSTRHKELKILLQRGVLDCFRGAVWQHLVQPWDFHEPGLYQRLRATPNNPCDGDIFRDVCRTFPRQALFRERGNIGQTALLNVLRACSVHCPEVGYCQGMGFLVGLLLTYMNEEDSFYMLVALLNKFKMAGLFSPGLPLLAEYFHKFESILRADLPSLFRHMHKESVDSTMYAAQWFMTLFTYSFPIQLVVRIWDLFLLQGVKVLFKIALAVLSLQRGVLMTESFEQMLARLKLPPAEVDADTLINHALTLKITRKRLNVR